MTVENQTAPELRWGVLGAGRIADQFLTDLDSSRPGTVIGVASSDPERARRLAEAHPGVEAFGGYDELLADPRIDAVYIATVHPQHAALIQAAAAAGKHILCEKPVTMDAATAEAAFAAAAAAGVQLLEAVQYRFQPQTERLRQAVTDGSIGVPLHIDVSCSFRAPYDRADRLFDPELGGGGILDVGIYAMSYALMVAGWAAGREAVEPTAFTGGGHLTDTGVDDWALARLSFESGFSAQARSGTRLDDPMHAVIYGSAGHIRVENPWVPGKDGVTPAFVLSRIGEEPETVVCTFEPLFGAEVVALERAVATGQPRGMSPAESLVNMRALDSWRALVGGAPA